MDKHSKRKAVNTDNTLVAGEEIIKGKKKRTKKIILIIISVILALLIAAASVFFALWKIGKDKFHKNDRNIDASTEGVEVNEDTVTYDGKDYILNKNIVSVLFIGVDKENINNNLGFGKNGQADTLFVAAVDTKTKEIKIIPIRRETMTAVDVYTVDGAYSSSKVQQICLAYSYGNSSEKSCENTKLAVCRFLLGMNVSSYIAINLKGISEITDRLGGITLNPIEKVELESGRDCSPGKDVTLYGKDAINYVQNRDEDINGSVNRLERQKQFLSVLASTAGNKIMSDFTKLRNYYGALSPYTSSDLSFSQITYLVSSCISKNIGSSIKYNSIEGEMKMGEEWAEFIPDGDSVIKTVIDTFYIPKK